jgi:GTP-binding protein
MPIPRVAIVGRPNVGKSSLMNMIAGSKVSIVDPTPGVTRDRVTAVVDLQPPFRGGIVKPVEFVDTGGFGVYVAEGQRFDEIGEDLSKLTAGIEGQIEAAIGDADLVLFAIDAQAGLTPQDQEIARLLREGRLGGSKTKKGGKGEKAAKMAPKKRPPIRIVATKVDGPKWEAHASELAGLGFGEPLPVSSKNNYFRRDFMDAIYEMLPEPNKSDEKRVTTDLQIAIVGKRNAGKSTLVNTLAGEPRMIVSEIAGTTRDAVDVRFEMDGKSIVAIDTAGLRRKRSFQNMIEHFAFDRVQRAIDRADVLLLLIDATEKISQVDEQLAMMAVKAFKPVIVVVNKWDLVEGKPDRKGKPITTATFTDYLRAELKGLWFAPISFVSGQDGRNVGQTIDLAFELRQQSAERVTTGKLNRLVRSIIEQRGPTDIKGTFAKVYYVAQTGVEPPTITLVVNKPDLFTPNYMRFLMNRFREELPFSEVPIRIVIRERRQREGDLAAAGEEGDARVSRGRKGVHERMGSRKSAPMGDEAFSEEPLDEMGEELLSDEFSEVVNIDGDEPEPLGDDAAEYFED